MHLLDHILKPLYSYQSYLFTETPHGFACLIITVPIFLGRVFEILKAAYMSL